MSSASGSRTATTPAATPGSSSATPVTDPPAPTAPWQQAEVLEIRRETPRAKTIRLRLSTPVRHVAGQHYVVRLTAADGYRAQRSYSVASAPDDSGEVELTVELLDGGEVSGFLHEVLEVG